MNPLALTWFSALCKCSRKTSRNPSLNLFHAFTYIADSEEREQEESEQCIVRFFKVCALDIALISASFLPLSPGEMMMIINTISPSEPSPPKIWFDVSSLGTATILIGGTNVGY